MKQSRLGWALALVCCATSACDSVTPSNSGGAGTAAPEAGTGAGGTASAGTGGVGAGGTGTGGTGIPTGTPKTCAEITCKAPAVCDDASGDADCFCPDGYYDVQGDGSLCEDIDECDEGTDDCADQTKTCMNTVGGFDCTGIDECAKSKTNDCHAHATCTDTADGYECACDAPWVGNGKNCDCPSGFTLSGGDCLADDGADCDDDANCLHDACVDGICCAQACDSPANCETENGATCTDGATCAYPMAPNGSSCTGDANPCTVDKCMGGVCDTSTAKVCDDTAACAGGACDALCTTDSCDPADTTGDPCRFVANTVACDDGNPCTVTDTCSDTFCDGAMRNCSDANVCTTDGCDPSDTGPDPCTHTNNTVSCDDGSACTDMDKCAGGTCSNTTPVVCNDGNVCTNDSCDVTLGCLYSNNTAACSDGSACTGTGPTGVDACAGGVCAPGATRNCDDGNVCKTDTCNGADTDGDPCVHTNNSVSCNDDNSCTPTDTCSGGNCGGSGNACGANSSGCSGGAGQTQERTCSCNVNYAEDEATDVCAPITNQCLLNPCDTNATCLDPTPTGTMTELCDPLCTCKAGYTGTGCPAGCTDVNECTAGNPCGEDDMTPRGSCNNTGGSYTCTCAMGFTLVGGTCVCDMNGTFAIRIRTDVSWSGITNVENGSDTTYSWALRTHNYMPNGTLEVETIPCGGTTPDICGTSPILGAEAYAQFLTNQIWGIASMPTEILSMNLPNALPGQAFVTSQTAVLLGIHLTNPLGTWPSSNNNVGTVASPGTNGAYWVNHDNDSNAAVTIYAVPPGGIGIDGNIPDPPFAFASTSAVCPRGGGSALSYAWWPGVEGLSVQRVKRFYAASRVISYLSGSLTSCDVITGDVAGPNPDSASDPGTLGEMKNDGRFQGCTRCTSGSSAGCGDTACSGTLTDFFDNQSQTQQVTDASFIIKRVSGSTTCAQARALSYP